MAISHKFPIQQIAYKQIGVDVKKPTIIFLHDSLGCISLWRDFPEKIGELAHCNVLIYDRQGYGDSCAFTNPNRSIGYLEEEADILMTLLDYWGLEEVILFGHSDGGSIALIAAGKYPHRIKGVVTEGAHVFVEDVTLSGINNTVELYKSTNLKVRLEKYHGSKTDDLFWAWAKTWNTPAFRNWNIGNFLSRINCPALIIQGEQDEYGTLLQVECIVKEIGLFARSLVLPNTQHTPHKESREEVVFETVHFLNSFLSR